MQAVQHLNTILQNGSGEFAFAEGVTTLAAALSNAATAVGWLEFGALTKTSIKPSTESKEVKRAVRGALTKTKTTTSGSIEFGISCAEAARADLVAIALMGTEGTAYTQSAVSTPTAMATILYPTAGFKASRSYPLMNGSNRQREILTYSVANDEAGVACTAANSGDTITATAHGLSNGDYVRFAGSNVGQGLVEGTPYLVANKTDNTFTLTDIAGSAIVITGDIASNLTFKRCMVPDVDYVLDTKLGLIRFLGPALPTAAAQILNQVSSASTSTGIVVYVTASAITATDDEAMTAVTLLDSISKTGYGWIRVWDDVHPNKLAMEMMFKCTIASTGGSDYTGETESGFDYTVTIDSDTTPTMYVAKYTNN